MVFSTGNVYPFVPVIGPGADENVPPEPVGEYAQSCLGRERIFQYFSGRAGTPVILIRLNYANEPRYGIVVDLVQRILEGEPIDLSMGHVNLIWQGDANDYVARAIALAAKDQPTVQVTVGRTGINPGQGERNHPIPGLVCSREDQLTIAKVWFRRVSI
ncbi:MAG: hypothetical protein JW820_09105 [Spirochaetales bacterium]|nr:hypothetical protein [Spirochaetales bacterium]